MFSPNQMTAKVEQITNDSMDAQESPSLPDRFELTHTSLP
jgi:hypothetical protein